MTVCPCPYPDVDPDGEEDTCACGHVLDEHDDFGDCLVEMEES